MPLHDETDIGAILNSGLSGPQSSELSELVRAVQATTNYGEVVQLAVGFFEQIGAGAVNCALFDNQDMVLVGFSSSMRSASLDSYDDQELGAEDPLIERMKHSAEPAILGWGYGVTAPWRRGRGHLILEAMQENGYFGLLFLPVRLGSSPYSASITIATEVPADKAQAYLKRQGSLLVLAAHFLGMRAAQLFQPGNIDDSWRARRLKQLSTREFEVVKALSEGLRPEKIAHQMKIKPVTVHMHVASARQKLGARTREQLVSIALQKGLL